MTSQLFWDEGENIVPIFEFSAEQNENRPVSTFFHSSLNRVHRNFIPYPYNTLYKLTDKESATLVIF